MFSLVTSATPAVLSGEWVSCGLDFVGPVHHLRVPCRLGALWEIWPLVREMLDTFSTPFVGERHVKEVKQSYFQTVQDRSVTLLVRLLLSYGTGISFALLRLLLSTS